MPDPTAGYPGPRGEIEKLPSGSLRVRVYAGVDPVTRKRRYLVETVPAGPTAAMDAEAVRARLVRAVDAHRAGRTAPRPPAPPGDTAATPTATGQRGGGDLTGATIARLAGVSTATVSKVLNGRSGVAAETRRRVETVLREHRYRRPDTPARTASIEVVFYGMLSHLAVAVLHGVEQIARAHHLSVGFTDVLQLSTHRSWAQDLLARRPTGVVTVHLSSPTEPHALLTASAIPLVALDPTGEPQHPVPSVGATDWNGALAATRHLLDLGHRHIGVITGPPDRLCARARLDGIRAALDAEGVPLDQRLVRTGLWFAYEDGLNHGRELLRLADPPTAVLCGNDLQALGVYEAARQAGRRIPDDLSVVGFDDIAPTLWCGPAMTTVRQPFTENGRHRGQTGADDRRRPTARPRPRRGRHHPHRPGKHRATRDAVSRPLTRHRPGRYGASVRLARITVCRRRRGRRPAGICDGDRTVVSTIHDRQRAARRPAPFGCQVPPARSRRPGPRGSGHR
ncbi:LacI family DNA-binding transcriptional regulator [Phytohabitans sp. ZYX-F-186]|uniref:LacI family DNA-binding transcriptional regulator n=1 Tax=Phytohabitans maris TaxID=3071409 RepID=A0ABU0ZMQ5_9ACTN|nr:LacI family DNA-binding transcriptional regulator [Phytohabitans sp. ZYX-F-186]MDQ7908314.1 LacI family DNA-binding transcriptional regulator [Phytohabitans sp. ZYX-F-186]